MTQGVIENNFTFELRLFKIGENTSRQFLYLYLLWNIQWCNNNLSQYKLNKNVFI